MNQLDRWHVHEHLPERVAIPGFLRARRYDKVREAATKEVTLLTLYETSTVDVLASPAYIERLDNPTPLTTQTVPLMRRMRRSALSLVTSHGRGVGGHLSIWQFRPANSGSSDSRRRLTEIVAKAVEPVGVIAAHVFEPEIAATQAKDATTEGRATDTVAELPPWLLLVEAIAGRAISAAAEVLAGVVESVADEQEVKVEQYRLTIILSEPGPSQP